MSATPGSRLLRFALCGLHFSVRKHEVPPPCSGRFARYPAIWEKLIFGKTKAALGGRVKLGVTGGAPISKDTLQCADPAITRMGAVKTIFFLIILKTAILSRSPRCAQN